MAVKNCLFPMMFFATLIGGKFICKEDNVNLVEFTLRLVNAAVFLFMLVWRSCFY